jgi:sigma54-dependent transcription regulator
MVHVDILRANFEVYCMTDNKPVKRTDFITNIEFEPKSESYVDCISTLMTIRQICWSETAWSRVGELKRCVLLSDLKWKYNLHITSI